MDKHRLSLLVIGVLAIAILAGGFFLGVQPQLERVEAANTQTATMKTSNDMQQAKNDALAADNENLSTYKAELKAKQGEIPATRSQQPLINQINAAANSAGVTVQNLSFDAPAAFELPAGVDAVGAAGGTLVAVPMTLAAKGSRDDLEDFVRLLQKSDRIVTIAGSTYAGDEESKTLTLVGTTWVLMPVA